MRSLLTVVFLAGVLAGCSKTEPAAPPSDGRPEIQIVVGPSGYSPTDAKAPAGKPVRLTFTRTTDEGCGHQLAVPSLGIKRDLPLAQPVSIDVTMPASGSLAFTCGMDMYQGAIVVE